MLPDQDPGNGRSFYPALLSLRCSRQHTDMSSIAENWTDQSSRLSWKVQLQRRCPSWIPDCRYDKVSNLLAADHFYTSGEHPLMLDISNSTNTLTWKGVEVDTVASYGDRLASYGFGFKPYQEEVDFGQMAWSLFARQPSCSTATKGGDWRFEPDFYQTLTVGVGNSGKMVAKEIKFQPDAEV